MPHHHRSPSCRAAFILSLALPLAACGSETDANAALGNEAGGVAAQQAAAPASLPPAALAAWEAYAREQCALDDARFASVVFVPFSGTGEPVDQVEQESAADQGGFIAADFNGDGQPDFLIMTPGRGCVTQGPSFGNAGPPNDFVLSTADGYRVVDGFMGWTAAATVERRGERDVLVYAGGGFNGSCGVVTQAVWGWNGREMDIVERRNDRGESVDREGCTQAQAAASAGSATFPPLPQGIYAGGLTHAGTITCAMALAEARESDRTPGDIYTSFTERAWGSGFEYGSEYYEGMRVERMEALGDNRYRLHGQGRTTTVTIHGPGRFTQTEDGDTTAYTHCPDNSVPAWVRQEFARGGG